MRRMYGVKSGTNGLASPGLTFAGCGVLVRMGQPRLNTVETALQAGHFAVKYRESLLVLSVPQGADLILDELQTLVELKFTDRATFGAGSRTQELFQKQTNGGRGSSNGSPLFGRN
jgi:hypothetical protein